MHDIDRTWSEFGGEMETGEMGFELGGETGFGELASPFNEVQEMELAAELLSVSNESELNYFLGSLIKKAGSAVGSFVSSPTGQALGGILKQAAKKALPVVGRAIGGYFGGSTGSDIGGKLASSAGDIFGLEQEGMNQEECEYETARQFVRFAGAAVGKAVGTSASNQPNITANQAAVAAAQRFMPGLMAGGGSGASAGQSAGGNARSGRWYRRGRKVVLIGL